MKMMKIKLDKHKILEEKSKIIMNNKNDDMDEDDDSTTSDLLTIGTGAAGLIGGHIALNGGVGTSNKLKDN